MEQIEILHLRPSIDLGKLAIDAYNEHSIEGSKQLKWFLHKIYRQAQETGESDLLSHLLFDSCYTKAAEQLGFDDGRRNEDELIHFFRDGDEPSP